jgi:hypothetical protein
MAFHEKAGRSQVDACRTSGNNDLFSRRVATVAMLPSALSRSDSFRSVHIGRSRLSRCCYLIGALWFCSCGVEPGPGLDAVTGTRLWAFVFSLPGTVSTLFCVLSYAAAGSATGLQLCNGSYTSPLTHKIIRKRKRKKAWQMGRVRITDRDHMEHMRSPCCGEAYKRLLRRLSA